MFLQTVPAWHGFIRPQNAHPGEALLLRVQQVDSLRDQQKLVASAS